MLRSNICVSRILNGEEREWKEGTFEERVVKNFLELVKNINPHI